MIAFATLLLGLVTGVVPITLLVGEGVAAVVVEHDGRPVGVALAPDWEVTLDMGDEPAPGLLEAVAYDADGRELGAARQWINLPHPAAELEVTLSGGARGVGVVAQLAWDSVMGAEALEVTVTFDGTPVTVENPWRVELPPHDPRALHILRAEARFPEGLVAVKELVFGGPHGDSLSTELAAVPLRLEGRREPTLAELTERLAVEGRPLGVVAIEKGDLDIVVVADRASGVDLARLAARVGRVRIPGALPGGPTGRQGAQRIAPLPRGSHLQILLPVADRLSGSAGDRNVFQPTRPVSEWDGGLLWHLMQASRASPGGDQQLADAVAVAGLVAAQNGRRRVVLLLLGETGEDHSRLTPGAARRYLSRLGVPLHVWVIAPGRPSQAHPWGEVEHVPTLPVLEAAARRLWQELERHRLVWVDGFHLPHQVREESPLPGARLLAIDPPVVAKADEAPTRAIASEVAEEPIEAPTQTSPALPRLGAWELSTDVRGSALLAALEAVAEHLPAAYGQRYGLPVPVPDGELVLLYRRQEDFRALLRRVAPGTDLDIQGHAQDGVASLYVGSRTATEVRATLVHELTHLLNRSAFEGELPPWLDEGLAEDMGYSRVDRHGRLVPGALRVGVSTRERGLPARAGSGQARGYEVRLEGPLAGVTALLRSRERGASLALADLLELDRGGFAHPEGRQLHYAASGLLVAFLLEGERRDGFRRFLAAVAEGGEADAAALEGALDEPLADLEVAFYQWLRRVRLTNLGSPRGS